MVKHDMMKKHRSELTIPKQTMPTKDDVYNPYLETILKEASPWHLCTSYTHHIVKLQNC